MMIDFVARGWMNPDKNLKVKSSAFIGTAIQSLGDLKGYVVQIILQSQLTVPSIKKMSYEDTLKLEQEIWDVFEPEFKDQGSLREIQLKGEIK